MLVQQKPSRHRSLSSAATVHQPGNRTQKFPHPTCSFVGLKLFSATWLSGHGDPSSPCLQGSCFSYYAKLFSTFVLSLGNFLCYFCPFHLQQCEFSCQGDVIIFGCFLSTVLDSFSQSQPQSLLHTWEVLICRWNRKWELFFSPHRFPFAHTIPARSLWSKKPSHTVGVNSLLDSMAAFWAVLYLSDESIRSQVNHQSLQKRKHCSEMHLKIQKTFICSLPFNSKIPSSKQASTWIKFLLWNKRLCALWNNMKAFFRPTSLISHRYNRSHTRLTY